MTKDDNLYQASLLIVLKVSDCSNLAKWILDFLRAIECQKQAGTPPENEVASKKKLQTTFDLIFRLLSTVSLHFHANHYQIINGRRAESARQTDRMLQNE